MPCCGLKAGLTFLLELCDLTEELKVGPGFFNKAADDL